MFRGMEYIYAVWKEKSFSNAAKKLYITQPALSNSVKRVEDKVGAPIFDRSTSPIQLTDVGREYLHAVEQILAIQENFSHYLSDSQNLKTGRLTIGSGAMISSYLLPDLIARYKGRFPSVEVDVVEGSREQLEKLLADGMIDLVIENSRLPDTLFEGQLLQEEHILLAVPKGWPVNRSLLAWQQSIDNIVSGTYLSPRYPAVPLEKFQNHPFVLVGPGDENHQRALELCRAHSFVPQVILTLDQQLTAYNMACAGLGAAFVSDTLVRSTLPHPDVVYYKLEGEAAQRDIRIYYKRGRYMPHCVRQFLADAAQSAPLEQHRDE